MTPAEAAELLAHCAAFDNRQPSIAAAQGWAKALYDVPLDDDAFAAIDVYYGTPAMTPGQRLWIMPADVRAGRAKLREERLKNWVYEPPEADRDPNYLERTRQQRKAVASGAVPAPTNAPALTDEPHPSVAQAIAGALRIVEPIPDPNFPPPYVPEMARQRIADAVPNWADRYERMPELAIACPKPDCRALERRPCKRPSGKELRETTHASRQEAWASKQEQPPAAS